jgi:small-conductance mechanosensitive channel
MRHDLSRRAWGVAAALLVLVVAAAGCGSESSSAEEQTASSADGLCGTLVTWQKNVTAAGEKVSQGQLSKASIEDASKAVGDANKQLRDDLSSLGKPPTPSAEEAKSALQQLSDDLSMNVDQIREALGSASGSGISAAVAAASGAVQAMGQDLQNTTTKLQSLTKDETWSKAFKSSDSCQKLTG